jgi:predicted permease
MTQLLTIFLNVLTPVFALILLGYLVGPLLGLESRTLSRFAYFIITPAFIFDVLSTAKISAALAARMTIYIVVVHVGCALLGFGLARLLRRSAEMTAAYVLIAVFGNVGNFGLPIVQFAMGREALAPATVYFLAILTVSFVLGVVAASWARGGGLGAVTAVLKTPALIALPPALLVNWSGVELPLVLTRPVALLAGALIPTMLVALGVQLAAAGIPRPSADMVLSSAVRLLGGPALAIALAVPFGMSGVERDIGILQSSMPAAVLASMLALEHELIPAFVTMTVLFSTLASLVTLTLVLSFISG